MVNKPPIYLTEQDKENIQMQFRSTDQNSVDLAFQMLLSFGYTAPEAFEMFKQSIDPPVMDLGLNLNRDSRHAGLFRATTAIHLPLTGRIIKCTGASGTVPGARESALNVMQMTLDLWQPKMHWICQCLNIDTRNNPYKGIKLQEGMIVDFWEYCEHYEDYMFQKGKISCRPTMCRSVAVNIAYNTCGSIKNWCTTQDRHYPVKTDLCPVLIDGTCNPIIENIN